MLPTMSIPTHKRHFQSESSISIDDMIDWSEEEPMEEEASVPHLLGSLSAMDSFGMDDGASPGPPQQRHNCTSMREGDDPLSRRDSVFNPSPLVLSVCKIYPDEEASIESATSTFRTNTTNLRKVPPPSHVPMPPRFTLTSPDQTPVPRRVSDGSEMAVDTLPQQTPSRRGSHRRDSANSLPTDLEEVIMGFRVLA